MNKIRKPLARVVYLFYICTVIKTKQKMRYIIIPILSICFGYGISQYIIQIIDKNDYNILNLDWFSYIVLSIPCAIILALCLPYLIEKIIKYW